MWRRRCSAVAIVSGHVNAFAPGRVNLIGEHTDYNDGLALPFAIDEGVTVEASAIEGDRIEALALDLDDEDSFSLERPPPAGVRTRSGGGASGRRRPAQWRAAADRRKPRTWGGAVFIGGARDRPNHGDDGTERRPGA